MRAKAWETALTRFGGIFFGLDAVQNVLCFSFVVNARVVAPPVRGKDERRDEIQLAIAGSPLGITRSVRLTAPGEIALARAVLMLHVTLAPTPQAVEDVLLAKLHSNHHAIRHPFSTGIVVLDVGNVTHCVADFKIHFVGTSEDVVEYFLQLGVDFGL